MADTGNEYRPFSCQERLSRTAFVLRVQQNCEIEEVFLQQLPQSAPSILTPMPQCPLGSASLRFLCDLPCSKFQKHLHSLFKCSPVPRPSPVVSLQQLANLFTAW